MRKQGGDLRLVHLPRDVRQLLQITHLVTVFEIHDNVESAVRAFGGEQV